MKRQKISEREQRDVLSLLGEVFGEESLPFFKLHLDHLGSRELVKVRYDQKGESLLAHIQICPYEWQDQKVAYLYAVCTAKEQQGRGIMKRFLPEVLKELTEEGYAVAILIPAERWLVSYYESFGFAESEGRTWLSDSFCPWSVGEGWEAIYPSRDVLLYLLRASTITGAEEQKPRPWMYHFLTPYSTKEEERLREGLLIAPML